MQTVTRRELTDDELREILAAEHPQVDGVAYTLNRDDDGIRVYGGNDRATILGIITKDGKNTLLVLRVGLGQRWIFTPQDHSQAGRLMFLNVRKAYRTPAA